jgi:hypothetical protein
MINDYPGMTSVGMRYFEYGLAGLRAVPGRDALRSEPDQSWDFWAPRYPSGTTAYTGIRLTGTADFCAMTLRVGPVKCLRDVYLGLFWMYNCISVVISRFS